MRTALVMFYGRFGLPVAFRAPFLYAIGRPLQVPQVDKPSREVRARKSCLLHIPRSVCCSLSGTPEQQADGRRRLWESDAGGSVGSSTACQRGSADFRHLQGTLRLGREDLGDFVKDVTSCRRGSPLCTHPSIAVDLRE